MPRPRRFGGKNDVNNGENQTACRRRCCSWRRRARRDVEKEPDHPHYGITYTGLRAGKGVVAVDKSVVQLMSEMYVPGYGFAIAGDIGGGVKGKWIDLGYDEDNLVLWYSWVDVYLLTPPPLPRDILYILPNSPIERVRR